MYRLLVPQVLKKFGVAYISIGEMQKGYRNESYEIATKDQSLNLIFHKREPQILERIKLADTASRILAEQDLPVRIRVDSRTLQLKHDDRRIYAGLYSYLPGETIPWEMYTMDHIKLVGQAMSDMHAAWKQSETVGTHVVDELRPLLSRMERYFSDSAVIKAVDTKLHVTLPTKQLKSLGAVLKQCRELPDEHLLHMDLVRGNLLFSEASAAGMWNIEDLALTGVIDFEKVAYGHAIFDIARTLAFLFVDCAAKSPDKIFKYFINSGYNKRGHATSPLGDVTMFNLLGALIGFFLLHDFYKFLRHTPYESLVENYHYVRTRDILIDYGMIRYSKD